MTIAYKEKRPAALGGEIANRTAAAPPRSTSGAAHCISCGYSDGQPAIGRSSDQPIITIGCKAGASPVLLSRSSIAWLASDNDDAGSATVLCAATTAAGQRRSPSPPTYPSVMPIFG